MPSDRTRGLNEPGVKREGVTRVLGGAALHASLAERTSAHAHHAWKLHVGLDAPVWLKSAARRAHAHEGARVLLVPPGVEHETGAVGWSLAVFLSPVGQRLPWQPGVQACVVEGQVERELLGLCRQVQREGFPRGDAADFVSQVVRLSGPFWRGGLMPDARVSRVLRQLREQPADGPNELARGHGMSLDRLSRLVRQGTGIGLRQHLLWSRLLRLLSGATRYPTLAAAAADAGFADHAHLTRTYRRFLGRCPSEFAGPPDVLEPW